MQTLEKQINDHLSYIYCDNCKFNEHSKEYWEEKLGYYGCEDCHRKMMGWEPSPQCIQELITLVKESNVQN